MDSNQKYLGITIGPIIKTLSMARKPRELWSASYLFSHLMRCIIETLPKGKVISPAVLDYSDSKKNKTTVGLYPDRVFLEGEIEQNMITTALKRFSKETGLTEEVVWNYFNVMWTSVEAEEVKDAVSQLNKNLDLLELNKRITEGTVEEEIIELIGKKSGSPLFTISLKSNDFPIESLGEIGAANLKQHAAWNQFRKLILTEDNEDAYAVFDDALKSYHKYICIVQADGDNMGKVVSNTNGITAISKSLLAFGQEACGAIADYGGLPIYAGGDDLLFIAPVVGNNKNIFDLLKQIDELYKNVQNEVDRMHIGIETSMSYGVSITYYKFPLYEALTKARKLLFEQAKNVQGKNAIAWELQKHSGSSFAGSLSKSTDELYAAFEELIKNSPKEAVVSAVSHKIQENEGLLALWAGKADSDTRILAFFKKYMEYKEDNPDPYLASVKNLMRIFYDQMLQEINNPEWNTKKATSEMVKTIYGMLRTAKFINGEEVKQ